MKNLLLILSATVALASLRAQNNPAVNQADTTRQQRDTDKAMRGPQPGDEAPPLYEDENADVGPQSILRQKKPSWIRFGADAQMFYTDNMLYAEHDKKSAGVAVTTVEAALTTPPCITRFASYRAEVGYRHQFFNYFGADNVAGKFDAKDFDFDSSTAFAAIGAQTKHYQFSAGFDYTRLLGFKPLRSQDYEDFYHESVPRWSMQRNFRVCDRSMFSLAYLGSYHFSREDQPLVTIIPSLPLPRLADDRSERWEHTFLAAYSAALPHHFVAQPFYRFQLNDFVSTGDLYMIHTLGLSAGWYPCANFSVRGFVGYNWSDASNSHAVEYTKLDAGGGLSATLRF